MQILGMDFSCAIGSLQQAKFPQKDCLLPLISRLLGYSIVAASTTVKLPQASQHAIFFFARVPQIWTNFKNKSTGELSFITSFMNFGGSMVRVFTSIQENAPTSVVLGSVIGILTNGTILSQIVFYQKSQVKKEKKDK